jgi:drug/metabolite transporter (DMT)-like permease
MRAARVRSIDPIGAARHGESLHSREPLRMIPTGWLWVVFTVIAAVGQTARNAMQRELTQTLGTVGATHVRFLFGFPFALFFLVVVWLVTGLALPRPGASFWLWVLGGACTQILATALMLAAMNKRSFVVATAYIKTEPVQVAVFGLLFLGDALTPWLLAAILIATGGVMVMSWKSVGKVEGGLLPTFLGLGAGAMFAFSAVGYRGAILSLGEPHFLMAATFTLAVGLTIQAIALTLYLALRDPAVLRAIARAWRPSLLAGAIGATASQFWFLAFSIATAASVRTLALIEVLFAQAVSHILFRQPTTPREVTGIVLIVVGVVMLLWAH